MTEIFGSIVRALHREIYKWKKENSRLDFYYGFSGCNPPPRGCNFKGNLISSARLTVFRRDLEISERGRGAS